MKKIETITKDQLKQGLPNIQPGDTIKVYQKIKEKDKERLQAFEGVVLARKHGKGINATITVRKIVAGVGVEKIFPIHTPTIGKIEVLKKSKVRRAKLYYLRTAKGKKARLKRKELGEIATWEEEKPKKEEPKEEVKKEAKELKEEKKQEPEEKK